MENFLNDEQGNKHPSAEEIAFGRKALGAKYVEEEKPADKVFELLEMVKKPDDQLSLALLIRGGKPACIIREDPFVSHIVQMLQLPHFRTNNPPNTIFIAKDHEVLEKIREIDNTDGNYHDFQLGQVLGYPETAVNGFIQRNSIRLEDLPDNVRNSGILEFVSFVFSRENWREELNVLKEQIKSVKDILPDLYDKVNWEKLEH